ncbi:hypothetical protein GMSM_22640 [Geomonas sp. Red276]
MKGLGLYRTADGGASWQGGGGGGGDDILSIAFSPSESGTQFLGEVYGGVTRVAGGVGTNVTSGLPVDGSSNVTVYSLAVDPTDGRTVYAVASPYGGGAKGLYKALILTIGGTPAAQVYAGGLYGFTPTASGATGFAIANKPSWASFDAATGTLSGTPTLTDLGTTSGIVITALYRQGQASLPSFSVTVVTPPPPPVSISGTPSGSVTAGGVYRFVPTSANASGFTIVNRPPWASFDPAAGALTGTPVTADAGTYPGIVISATNGVDTVALPAFSIVVVPIAPPTLAVSTLPDHSFTADATLNVTGNVWGVNGITLLTINGIAISFDRDGNFSRAVTLTEGGNQLTIVATDTATNTTTDRRVITLDRSVPVIDVSNPPDNSVTARGTITVSGTVSEQATVQVAVNDGAFENALVDGSGFSASCPLVPGNNTILVTATDPAGNRATAKRSVLLDVSRPSLAITDPDRDITVREPGFLLKGTAGDPDSAVTVTVSFEGAEYSPAVTGGAFGQQLTFTSEKQYPVIVTATDQAGNNSTTVSRNIIYTSLPPGDLNGDGYIDIADVWMTLQWVVGNGALTEPERQRADVAPLDGNEAPRGDGVVDIADVIIMLRRVVGAVTW